VIAESQISAGVGQKVTAIQTGGYIKVVSAAGIDSGNIKTVYVSG